ncbi:MAG: RDD family protein [Clostridiales bacterium]|nr:RDD family protein [Clostridiales bacterium]
MFELRKTGIVRRASAALLDVILLVVLTTGFMFILSLICDYSANEKLSNRYYGEWEEFRKTHVATVAEYYGYDYQTTGNSYTITKNGEKSSLDALMKSLGDSKGEDVVTKPAYDAYMELPSANKVNWQYQYVYNLLFMMTSVGLLLAYVALEFVMPLIFKNGQTVGKKVFGICLVRPDCVKITNLSLFARTILGKYAIETMFPVLLVFLFIFGGIGVLALILLAALALLNIVLFFATKNRTPIHDLIAGTVSADMRTQMIFQTEDELVEKKALAHKELVGQANG